MKENEDWQVVVSRAKTAEKLKSERKKRGLTQKEFADLLGICAKSLRRYERGERNLSLSARLKGILRLGVDLSPSISLFKISELSTLEYHKCSTSYSTNVGVRLLELRAESRAFRRSNFSWLARKLMNLRDLALIFISGYITSLCISIKVPLFHSASIYAAGWVDLFFVCTAPLLVCTMLVEIPFTKVLSSNFWRIR